MSKETLDLMLGLNRQELEIQIALQCAPLLTGRKISNLLTVDKRFRSAVLRLFRSSAVSCYVLYESDDRITFLCTEKTGSLFKNREGEKADGRVWMQRMYTFQDPLSRIRTLPCSHGRQR